MIARTKTPPARFTPGTLAFLRALTRHNDREWFKARKDSYESCVRAPMVAVVERLATDFARFAPDIVASPKDSMFRPYRDTRFSEDKRPLKTNVSAFFQCRGLGKREGAGLYLEVACERVLVAGGIYAPHPIELQRVREHVADNHVRFRALVESPSFVRSFGALAGDSLKRVPRGFPPDHPAAEYLRLRHYVGVRQYPASFAASPRFYATIVGLFERLAPFVRFLNEPLLVPRFAASDLSRADPRPSPLS